MIKGFRDFILRGNVVELAVAVVIGGAFTALVAVFGEAFINPLIAVVGGPDSTGWGFQILAGNDATFVDIGAVVTAVITFVITAAVVYFLVVAPMNSYQARVKAKLDVEPEPEEIPADVELLKEIRDLLAERRPGGSGVDTS
ncbi:MAG: large conductance mechanosensitive channel protein MscL [Jiangellales bacterium]